MRSVTWVLTRDSRSFPRFLRDEALPHWGRTHLAIFLLNALKKLESTQMCVSELIFHQSTKRTVKKRQKILTLSSFLIFDYSEICRKCYCCWQYVCEKSFCFQNYPLIIRPHHAQQKAHKLTMNFHSSKKVMRLWASKQKKSLIFDQCQEFDCHIISWSLFLLFRIWIRSIGKREKNCR